MKSSFFRISDGDFLPKDLKNVVVAIGNFDGVHLGHQHLLAQALKKAQEIKGDAIILTFEPHPKSFFQKQQDLQRLTEAEEKAKILEILGFRGIIEQNFDSAFAKRDAYWFIEEYLCKKLKAKAVIVGSDFCFGAQRQGDIKFLQAQAKKHRFFLEVVPLLHDQQQNLISSSRVRTLLAQGDVETVARLLNYRYNYVGIVQHGAKLGRTIGFPTANIKFKAGVLAYGIYAIRLRCENGRLFDGVASIGVRPTIEEEGAPILECHLFNYFGNLYGKKVRVAFFSYLRPELKFANLTLLVKQIEKDVVFSQDILKNATALSKLDRILNF